MITKVSQRTEEKLVAPPKNPYGMFVGGMEVEYQGDTVEFSGGGWYGLFRPVGEDFVTWKRLPRDFPGQSDWEEYEEWKRSLGFLSAQYFRGEDFFPPDLGELLDIAGNLQSYDDFVKASQIVECIKSKNFGEAVIQLRQLLQLE